MSSSASQPAAQAYLRAAAITFYAALPWDWQARHAGLQNGFGPFINANGQRDIFISMAVERLREAMDRLTLEDVGGVMRGMYPGIVAEEDEEGIEFKINPADLHRITTHLPRLNN